jgi:hypothetical protein
MIAEAVSEEAPVAPLFAAMATDIHYTAAQIGQAGCRSRPCAAAVGQPGRGPCQHEPGQHVGLEAGQFLRARRHPVLTG